MVEVPDVLGARPSEAFDRLRACELVPVLIGMPPLKSDGYSWFEVTGQEPTAGAQVVPGSRIAIAFRTTVTLGYPIEGPPVAPSDTAVPAVLGLALDVAMRVVAEAGFVAVAIPPDRSVTDIEVRRQEPEPGGTTNPWHEVALFLE